mmetsp:Transcript_30923/g.52239  ORF Transcript_30923/g.52239 Transcript_30923/m.52239 type:complete len:214 (-) Transcript_30923:37-678(-)
MSAKTLNVRQHVWCLVLEVQTVSAVAEHAVLVEVQQFHEAGDVAVQHAGLLGLKQPLALGLGTKILPLHKASGAKPIRRLVVKPTRHVNREEVAQRCIERCHLQPHKRGLRGVLGPQIKTFTAVIVGKLSHNSAFLDQIASWGLQHRHEPVVEVQVPLRLLVQVDLHILEGDLLQRKSVPRTAHKRAQRVTVHAEVGLVHFGFGRRPSQDHAL